MYRSEIQVTKSASWNHRMVKVGNDLYDPWVQPQPISTIPTNHVSKSHISMALKNLLTNPSHPTGPVVPPSYHKQWDLQGLFYLLSKVSE